MLNTCSVLPTPAEFDLLDIPNQIARLPFDIDAALDSSVQCLPDTPAGRIALHLPEARGQKLLNCRSGGFIFRYHDGHRAWRPCFPCQLAIACAECAMDQADEQFGKYRNLNSLIQFHNFTRITVPLDPTTTPKAAYASLMQFLHKHLPKAATVAKVKPSSDIVEILYCTSMDDSTAALLLKHYPSAIIRRHCLSTFERELHRVLDADTFTCPEHTALADGKYMNTRLLRTQGLSREERKDLSLMAAIRDKSTGDESNLDNSTSPKGEKLYHRTASGKFMPVPPCPCGCGAAPTHFGRGKYEKDDSSDINWVQVDAVTNSQRINQINLLKTNEMIQ